MDNMAGLFSFLSRNYYAANPTPVAKNANALRFGLLGASNIAPMAVIGPSKSHPDIIIAAVAARDIEKAKAYAKKHNIPNAHGSYQALLDDPTIDVIYNALPNSLHYEWALKALAAGKHVLLEKPSTSNLEEAELLFNHQILKRPNAPVLLEAFHTRFHPAFRKFVDQVDQENVDSAFARFALWKGFFDPKDIRLQYALAGGALMDLGVYPLGALRQIFGTEPTSVISSIGLPMPGADPLIDQKFTVKYEFPNSAIGTLECDMNAQGGYYFPLLTSKLPAVALPKAVVIHKPKTVENSPHTTKDRNFVHTITTTVTMYNFLMPSMYHRIDVEDVHILTNAQIDGKSGVIKTWVEKRWMKEYGEAGKESWTTYRHMLEAFVGKVRGQEVKHWISGEDSIAQMKAVDLAYGKSELPLRETSAFRL